MTDICNQEVNLNDYLVSPSDCINVLIIGRSQAGKSSIIKTLLDVEKGTSSTGFSETRDPECNKMIVTAPNGTSYQVNIIDTPGLQERRESNVNRSDETLLKLASKCVEENITTVNVVCFVSVAGKTHMHDTEVFKKMKEFLGNGYSDISMMVLTHCDEYGDKELGEFEDNIRTHDATAPFYNFCKLGIARMGSIDIKKLSSHSVQLRELIKKERLERIKAMRKDFLDRVISCANKRVWSKELKLLCDEYKNEQKKILEKVEEKAYSKGQLDEKKKHFCATQ